MKACPSCHRLFPATGAFCAQDGTPLLPHEQVPCQADPDDKLLGTHLCGRYEIRRIVADGGMGRVYEARDGELDRRVAIKVLHAEVARDAIALERFKREYEISKDLPHAHIVEVFDFQRTESSRWIMVMEFLEGEELRAVLTRETRVSPARMVRILAQVAIGLDEAHRREFVHRDLKPDNLFLCDTEAGPVVKILDFGSVRINKNRAASKLTSLGTTIGSPWYMSPEQAQGAENLDHRADVFALGAIAYESLTGEVPFQGSNGPAILLSILTKNPPPVSSKVDPSVGVPSALDDVIDDALAKKPEMRTSTVGAFADAFGRALGLSGTHADWARWTSAELDRALGEARARGPAVPTAVDDPFASAPVAAPVHVASPSLAPAHAGSAMDDAFAQAGAGDLEPQGVGGRPVALYVVAGLVVLALVGGLVAYLLG